MAASVTARWLREALGWPVADDAAVTIEPISLTEGTMGEVFRVRAGGRAAILKQEPPPDSPWYQTCIETQLLERETSMYRFLDAPVFPERVAPRALFLPRSPEDGGLAIEEIPQNEADRARFEAGLDPQAIAGALETLAILHSNEALQPWKGPKAPESWLYDYSSDGLLRAVSDGLLIAPNYVASLLPTLEVARLLAPTLADVAPIAANAHVPARRHGLCHGDCWAGNLLFRARARPLLIDWQFAGWGNCLSDVALLLLSSTDPSADEDWPDHHLSRYHQHVVARIPSYTLADCRHDFDCALPFAALTMVATLDAYLFDATPALRARVAARLTGMMDRIPSLFGTTKL